MSTGISISSINRIKELAEKKQYAEALEILDTQDLEKSINPQFLRISGEIFRENRRYYDSRKILLKAHQMSPQGLRILYELIQLYLELGYFTKARKYYEQYLFYSTPEDIQKDYVEYIMKKATGVGIKELASILIPILERMPEDKWNFEAVLLYDKMERKDKALEECKYILENFKDSVFVSLVIQYIDDELNVDEYFYIYPREEIPEDEELFGDLIVQEDKILQEDYLRMNPPEARILVEAEDKEGIEAKSQKEKKPKKTKKRKAKEQNVNNDADAELDEGKNTNIGQPDLWQEKSVAEKPDGQLVYENSAKKLTEGNEEADISGPEQENFVESERIRQEREAALDKLLSKKISTEQIKKSAQQIAKSVKEIDTGKTKNQVKVVAESVKDNVKKATDVLSEAVGAKALLDDITGSVLSDDSMITEDETIVDGIIESVLEPPKKVVGQVVMNEELDALIPDSLEAMSAKEIADIEAKREEAERLELEALEASFKLEEAKKRARKKISDDISEQEAEDSQETVSTDNVKEMTQTANAGVVAETQTNHLKSVSEVDYSHLKEQLLKEIQEEQEEPLESLGFITIVQSDVDKSIEEDIPDTANMLHQMIYNKEFYTGDDSTKFESKASYDNHEFEIEDYEFESYKDVEKSIKNDIIEEQETNLADMLSVETIFAQEDVLDFDEIIPTEKEKTSGEFIVPEETKISEKTIIRRDTTVLERPIVPEEVTVLERPIVPEEVTVSEKPIVPEEVTVLERPIVSEDVMVSEKPIVPEDTIISEDIMVSERPVVSEDVIILEKPIISEEIIASEKAIVSEEIRNPKESTVIEESNLSEKGDNKINSDDIINEKAMFINARERLRVRILISDSMVKKLSDLKESR